MNEKLLELLFKIPDPITVSEFSRRTGKSESSTRKLVDRRRLPIRTEKQLYGGDFTDFRLMIMWNEYLEMIYEATNKVPPFERLNVMRLFSLLLLHFSIQSQGMLAQKFMS